MLYVPPFTSQVSMYLIIPLFSFAPVSCFVILALDLPVTKQQQILKQFAMLMEWSLVMMVYVI
jgi:hypothetical protein